MNAILHVEVVCAGPDAVWQRTLTLAAGATVQDALAASGVPQALPPWARGSQDDPCDQEHQGNGATVPVGIYGRIVPLTEPLREGDRVELYRPLFFDPKESRRRRAAHRQTHKQTRQQTQTRTAKQQREVPP